ncbi:MAG TPA: serine protease spb1, partial [Pseudobdellovibrionaceae bacterium]
FKNSQICIDLIWERKPTETEFGSFVLEFYNPDNRSQFIDPPGTLSVHIRMPSTDQGSYPVNINKLSAGQYRVSKVFFTMHGDWEIQLKLLNGSNILDQAVNPVHF